MAPSVSASAASASSAARYGVYDLRNNVDGTRVGCECEGWGVAISGTSTTGYANNAVGTVGLTLTSSPTLEVRLGLPSASTPAR